MKKHIISNNLKNTTKILLPTLGSLVAVGCDTNTDKEPNVIIIMTDDHTMQAMSCYNGLMETPNLDRIAKEGILMNNCFVSNAISGPSRACILTGKYSHMNGFTDNSRTFDGDQQTFPKLLQNKGYQTAMIGKWHLNSAPQGFDYWSILKGQGEYYSPLFIESVASEQNDLSSGLNDNASNIATQTSREVVEKGYVTDIITDKAIGFLNRRDKKRPFAMLYYHKAPHRNWMPAQRHLGLYEDRVFPEPENLFDDYSGRGRAAHEQEMTIADHMWPSWDLKCMTEEELSQDYEQVSDSGNANVDDVKMANDISKSRAKFKNAYDRMTDAEKANWNKAYARRVAEYKKMQGKVSREEMISWKYQQYMQDYCAVIKGVDENVGRLLDYLEKEGELDNTIIIYTSDQGFFLGEHGWFDKRFMYDECHRTPLLIRYPKSIKPGSTSDAMAMNIDLAPTILDYAGIEIPNDIQGLSLKEVLDNEGQIPTNWRDAVYYHYYEYPSWHSVKRHYGVRTDKYKLIHFYNDVDQWELYDLEKDPNEMNNVYEFPDYKDIKENMHKRLQKIQDEVKDNDPQEKEYEFFKGINKF